MMSPWKVLGWLLVLLLCLMLTAGVYGLALLYGWPFPSGKTLAMVGGTIIGTTLLSLLALKLYTNRWTPDIPASLPVDLPSDHLPRWLLFGNDIPFSQLSELFQDAGCPLLALEKTAETTEPVQLWSTKQAHWIAVAFSAQDAVQDVDETAVTRPLPDEDGGATNAAKTKKNDVLPSTWDRLLNDKYVRRWLSLPAGIVLCIDADSLSGSDGVVDRLFRRVLATRKRLGDAPVCLLVTGLERAPGLSRLVQFLTTETVIGNNGLDAPLGWFMPNRRPWTPVSRWATSSVHKGMSRLTKSLNGFVRCSDAGIPAPGGPAFLFEKTFYPFIAPLIAFAEDFRFDGVFWIALSLRKQCPPVRAGSVPRNSASSLFLPHARTTQTNTHRLSNCRGASGSHCRNRPVYGCGLCRKNTAPHDST